MQRVFPLSHFIWPTGKYKKSILAINPVLKMAEISNFKDE
jgi:hypothetical protein